MSFFKKSAADCCRFSKNISGTHKLTYKVVCLCIDYKKYIDYGKNCLEFLFQVSHFFTMPQTWACFAFHGMNFGMATFHTDFIYVGGLFHWGDNFYQKLYTFLIVLHVSGAQNSSFLHIFYPSKKYTQKVLPSDAGISVRKG